MEKLTIEVNHNKARYLKEAAQDALKDERHWSVIGSEDRAENAKDLARMVLDLFNEAEDECPTGCEECKAHQKNVGDV